MEEYTNAVGYVDSIFPYWQISCIKIPYISSTWFEPFYTHHTTPTLRREMCKNIAKRLKQKNMVGIPESPDSNLRLRPAT